jgi:hypothetical protein
MTGSRLLKGLPLLVLLAAHGLVEGQEVKLVDSDDRGLVLTLECPDPDLEPSSQQPGRVLPGLPGFPALNSPGEPSLPYARALVGVPEGTRPVLKIVRSPRRRLSEEGVAVNVYPAFGFTQEQGWVPPPEPPLPAGTWPRAAAEVAWTGWMRELQMAEIRLYPVRSAGENGGVFHHPYLEVRVDFLPDRSARPARRDRPPEGASPRPDLFREAQRRAILNADQLDRIRTRGSPVDGSREDGSAGGAAESGLETASSTPAPLKVGVTADGLYAIRPGDLQAAGVDPATVDPRDFRLEFRGSPVPVLVTGEFDGTFDPSDLMAFYGTAATGRFTRTNVYWLHFDGLPSRVSTRDGTFGAAAPTPASFETTVRAEQDLIYTQNVPSGALAHWWWKLQSAGDPASEDLTYTVELPNVDPAAHTLIVRANIQGRTATGDNPDHHTRIFLNGTQIDDQTWDGQIPFDHLVSPSSALISSGSNSIRIQMVGDVSFVDQVYVNFLEVTYRKTYDVTADALLAAGEGPGEFRFSFGGFSNPSALVYDVADPNAMVRIIIPAGQVTGSGPYSFEFQDLLTTDTLYAAATITFGFATPASIVQDVPSNLAGDPNGADYIIITPPDPNWISALQPLVSHRAAQGYRVLVATTEDIYDEFNFGIFDPGAIEAFLDHAWANYPGAAPEFVLLAGDAHVDYLDNYGSGVPQFVPAKLVDISSFGETPSDNAYATTFGGDFLPELITGRLPARSAADVTSMVNKILNYEISPPVSALNAQSLFVADDDDAAFEAILSAFASLTPPTMSSNKIYMTQVGAGSMPGLIKAGFDTGALMASYLGHGSMTQWAAECPWASGNVTPCFSDDPNSLVPGSNVTFVSALNCINGYHIDLAAAGAGHVDYSLAESMVRAEGRGAIAMWAPAALGTVSDYSSIGDWLFRNLFLDREYVLGRATITAVISAVTQPFSPSDMDNIRELTFFGDPATILALDSDGDDLTDSFEEGAGLDPLDNDMDDDGLLDGAEIALGTNPQDDDTDDDGLLDGADVAAGMDPLDGDTDDDGLIDSMEPLPSSDADGDGQVNGADADADGDGIFDGTEAGVTTPQPGTDTGQGFFVPDADPNTTTDSLDPDSDGGGAADGAEDRDFNGRVDPGETDPTLGNGGDDQTCSSAIPELANLTLSTSGPDLVLSWDDIEGTHPCTFYRVYMANDVALPKDSFTPFRYFVTGLSSFIHVGAAGDGMDHDYLVVAYDPLTGQGPLGHYGQ